MPRTNAFGQWVQQRRRMLEYTQQELATLAACADRTIRKIESGALSPSQQLAQRLAKALQIPVKEQATVVAFARHHPDSLPPVLVQQDMSDASIETPVFATIPNSPTLLFGREDDLDHVRTLILSDKIALVTLTGAPGVGKTRLVLALAAQLRSYFDDSVIFVSCAPLSDSVQILPAIAQHFGIQETQPDDLEIALLAALQSRQLLLILDNFEHLLEATPLLGRLLLHAPQLKMLITSRVRVHLSSEHVYVVPPLTIPDPQDDTDWSDWYTYGAVALFVHRAAAIDQQFTLTESNAPTIVAICQRLDGLPLAIELAAARSTLLPLPLLLQQLDQRLTLLTSGVRDGVPHQQTLQTTLEWSYTLLSADTQTLFRRLAVFVGGFTFEAITAIYEGLDLGDSVSSKLVVIMTHMGILVDHNLVQRINLIDSVPRFTMLETVRAYALNQLTQYDEMSAVQEQHANYYLTFVETANSHFSKEDRGLWLDRCTCELDNIRAALQWTADMQQQEELLRMSVAMSTFWRLRGSVYEGRAWLQNGVNRTPNASADLRVEALRMLGILALMQDDYAQAHQLFTQCLALRSEVKEQTNIARALASLGRVAYWQADYPGALAILDEGMALLRDIDDQVGLASSSLYVGLVHLNMDQYEKAMVAIKEGLHLYHTLQNDIGTGTALGFYGRVALYRGDYQQAATLLEQSLTILEKHNSIPGIARTLIYLGRVALSQEQTRDALHFFEEGLIMCQQVGDQEAMAVAFEGCAGVAIAHDQLEHAVSLKGMADQIRQRLGSPSPYADRAFYDDLESAIRTYLQEAQRHIVTATVRAFSVENALTDVNDLLAIVVSPTLVEVHLTRRELEVLQLVVRGLTNAQVAQQLVISPLTVNAHLRAIYRKLQVTSRGAAIRVALEHQLV
ncbi:MAG: LuxR C-terminal-related transcriptional regulator [Chloroflexota bacterium]